MKYSLFIMIIFVASITGVTAKPGHVPKALVALSKKLTALRSVSYQYTFESGDPATNSHDVFNGVSYIEFNQTDKQTVSRFRIESDEYMQIYNGTELISLNKKGKTYSIKTRPKLSYFSHNLFFLNSIQTLRSVIQQWVQSDSLSMYEGDTLIQNRSYTLLQVAMHRHGLYYMNDFEKIEQVPDSVTIYYSIIIDAKTGLPSQIVHTTSISNGFSKMVFTGINTRPKAPETNCWDCTTYESEYNPYKREKHKPAIVIGGMMPEWSLPEYNGKEDTVFKSSDLKGKVVLIDFWIKNCGPCMKSFPELQQLQKTYGGDRFQLVSINALDKKEEVGFFYKRENPLYKMLYNGEAMAKDWGVDGFPRSILIDRTGKVIYADTFSYDKLEALIKANL